MLLLLSNWVSHHAQRNLQTHHYHISNAAYLFAMVGCLFRLSLLSFSLITDGTFNTEKWLAILMLLLCLVSIVVWSYCKYSHRAIVKINPSWLFVLLIFLIDGTYKSDWHVCSDCVFQIQSHPLSFFSTSDIIIYCARLVWVYGPTNKQQYASSCSSAIW